MYQYPHTIDNGAGERLTVLRRVPDPDGGERLEVESSVHPGHGPPMHVHYFQEEGLTVLQGRIGYQCRGEEPRYAGVGETVVFTPGVAHRFWNAGGGEMRCTGSIRPPDSVAHRYADAPEPARR